MRATARVIDLSLPIGDGMSFHPQTPTPIVATYRRREEEENWSGLARHVARLRFVGTTCTYLTTPFQFDPEGADIASVDVSRLVDIPITKVEAPAGSPITPDVLMTGGDLRGRALLIATGHDRLFGEPEYWQDPPGLSAAAVDYLLASGVSLIGSDSQNLDHTEGDIGDGGTGSRFVFKELLGAGILLLQCLTRLSEIPPSGALLTAVPAPVEGTGSCPVRAVARMA